MRSGPLAALAGLALVLACGGEGADRPAEPRASLSVAESMRGDTAGYLRAIEPREFLFPADHGAHPGFRTEWWYFTGNLEGERGRRFGYQLTFFRNALAPPDAPAAPRGSAWAAREVWLAHFAVTDAGAPGDEGGFYAAERLARGAVGLAGVELEEGDGGAGRLRVWTEGWSVAPAVGPEGGAGPAALAPLRLAARQPGAAIDLRLRALRAPVLHGDAGLSRKGERPGDASYYYTIPRFETVGTVTVDGEGHEVRGLSWLDREWSTSALGEEQTGWDWFSLQLSDGRDLMLYLLRLEGGGVDRASAGTLMDPEGAVRPLDANGIEVEALDTWRADDGVAYPSGWRVRVPAAAIDLLVEPVRPDQELLLPETSLRYWEGAVDARGTSAGVPVTGRGYVELTGYADAAPAGARTGG